ncbi:MAG: Holliday junction branch migration protein RuvA [Canibacter sp.]
MISSLRGPVLATGSGWVVVDLSGLGIRAEVPTDLSTTIHPGDHVSLQTQLVPREDSLTLYGFDSVEALDMFNTLLGVSGVGPRSALGVLSTLTPADIAHAVSTEDDKPFRKVSGIGPKTAKLIMVSLAGKLDHIVLTQRDSNARVETSTDATSLQVITGLTGLGWPEQDAAQAVLDAQEAGAPDDAAALLRSALSLLQKPVRGGKS